MPRWLHVPNRCPTSMAFAASPCAWSERAQSGPRPCSLATHGCPGQAQASPVCAGASTEWWGQRRPLPEPAPQPRGLSLLQANLTKSQNEFKIVLKELEDSLLARLSAASGNFLGDTALVENLETTKHTASEIEEKVSATAASVGGRLPRSLKREATVPCVPRGPRQGAACQLPAEGPPRQGADPLPSGAIHLLVPLEPHFFLRYKRQKSQRLKSTRPERTTGQPQRGRPCCTSSSTTSTRSTPSISSRSRCGCGQAPGRGAWSPQNPQPSGQSGSKLQTGVGRGSWGTGSVPGQHPGEGLLSRCPRPPPAAEINWSPHRKHGVASSPMSLYAPLPQAFNMVFEKAIQKTAPAEEVKQRVINLTDEITYSVYMYTARGLFERDKLIFLAQVAFQASLASLLGVWPAMQIPG